MKHRLRISAALAVLLAAALLFWPRAAEEPPGSPPAQRLAERTPSAESDETVTPGSSHLVSAEPEKLIVNAVPGSKSEACTSITEPLAGFSDEALAKEFDRIAELLQASNQEEHWLAAAFLRSTDRKRALAEFSVLYEENPESKLAFWGLLAECVLRDGLSGHCSEERLIAGAEKFNGGQVWASLAGGFFEEGKPEAALAALERAATAPALAEPIAELFRIIEPTLLVSGEFNARQALTLLFAVPNNFPGYWGVLDACREYGAEDERWQAACTTFGARIEAESYALLTQRIGLLMQKEQASFANRPTVLAAIEARMADTESLIQQFRAVESIVMGEEALLGAYIEQLKNADEARAMRYLISEVERLTLAGAIADCREAE